jgi:hypothetical protein
MLLECLLHPNLIDKEQTWIYDCIPKKVNHQLKASLNAKTIGWGICINDGLDWNKIWTQVLVILGGCIIGALVGSICTGDWQSPWTIAGTISAALTSSLGFFATL